MDHTGDMDITAVTGVVEDNLSPRLRPPLRIVWSSDEGKRSTSEGIDLDPTELSFDLALDDLDERIAGLEASLADATDDRFRSVAEDDTPVEVSAVTPLMLARALRPSIFSPAAALTAAAGSDEALAEARLEALAHARRVLSDLRAQASDEPSDADAGLSEKLVHDARRADDELPGVAARLRVAAELLDGGDREIRRGRDAAATLAAIRLDYVPTGADRLVP